MRSSAWSPPAAAAWSHRDLQQLTGRPAFEIDRLLGGVFGRIIAGRTAPHARRQGCSCSPTRPSREQAIERLGPDILDGFAGRLHAWADGYRQRRWPADTPEYLLRGYPRMLADAGDADRLAALATDPARHHRMLDATGGDAAALAEITAAHALISTSASPDLLAALRLAWHRGPARRPQHPHPRPAPSSLGNPRAARTRRSPRPVHHRPGRAGTGPGQRGRGGSRRAAITTAPSRIARSITDPACRRRPWPAWRRRRRGDYDRAEQIARSITDPDEQARALADVAAAVAAAAICDRARADRPVHHQPGEQAGPWPPWRAAPAVAEPRRLRPRRADRPVHHRPGTSRRGPWPTVAAA